jgi:hypothetical protein
MREFGRIDQLAPPNELLAGALALLLAVFGQRDIRVARALPRYRPLRLSCQSGTGRERSANHCWRDISRFDLVLPWRAMKTLGVVAFASDILRAQLRASAPVCWLKSSKILRRLHCEEEKGETA